MSQTLNDKLEAYFKARPNTWIDGKVLARIAGGYGWRSRCSDIRRQRNMTIENRQRRVLKADGGFFTVSWYRFVPPVAVTVDENGQQAFL